MGKAKGKGKWVDENFAVVWLVAEMGWGRIEVSERGEWRGVECTAIEATGEGK